VKEECSDFWGGEREREGGERGGESERGRWKAKQEARKKLKA